MSLAKPFLTAVVLLAAGAPAARARTSSSGTGGAGAVGGVETKPPAVVLFKGATLWTMAKEGVIRKGDLLVRDGKIAKVAESIDPPSGALVVPAEGKHLTPGVIDAHSHTAVDGGVNEGANNVTAEVRIRDVLNPEDIDIYRELAGGLTTANVLHGSANSIGGQTVVIKLRWGEPSSELPFKEAPPGIKFALGENPKRSNFDVPPGQPVRYPTTRMGVASSIRKALLEAQDYEREWEAYERLSAREKERREPPRRDLQKDALVEILEGKRLVHAHCYRQDEILMLIRLAEEFGFRIATFQHVLEGYKVADEIAAHGAGGSTFSDWWAYKLEAYDAIPYNGVLMAKRGVVTSFNSDSDELARRLNLEAAKAIKYGGLSEEQALAFVTINPARQLKIDRWVGSLEEGKDADLALWSGHPLSTYTVCEQTWVDGIKRFDRSEDLTRREQMEKERAGLLEKVKNADKPKVEPSKEKKEEGKPKAGEAGKGPETSRPAAAEPEKPAEAQPVEPKGQKEKPGEPQAKPGEPRAKPGEPRAKTPPPAQPLAYRIPASRKPGTLALVGATIHPVSGPEIAKGTIVIGAGRIAAVGSDVEVPSGVEAIRLDGLHVYPGMIDADTVLGLTEIGSVRGSVDIAETGSMNPDERVEIAINPDSELIPVTRANGITHVLTAPRGGVISGTSALIRLDGWTWEDLAASAPAALHVEYPQWPAASAEPSAKEEANKAKEKALKELRQTFAAAKAYRQAREAEGQGAKRPKKDPALEAMLAVLEGKIPVIVHAHDIRQIKDVLKWAEEEGVRIILAGGADSWRIADLLKEKGVPVILGPVLTTPSRRDEPYDTPFTVARRLNEAGVAFCISGGGNASNVRNLPYHAAMAAAFGLPREEALKAVTLYPARILGLEKDLGSIEPGKSASLMVTDGDPLEIRTQVLRVFIDGKPADLMNKHRRLYERYEARPMPAERPPVPATR